MPYKGPHISIGSEHLVERVLGLKPEQIQAWPEDVAELAKELAAELFLVRYNPFIDPAMVRESVGKAFADAQPALAMDYTTALRDGYDSFWRTFERDQEVRQELIKRLSQIMPADCIDTRPNSLVEMATDATDLRMELPLLVLMPENETQTAAIVKLANELDFALVPRGGGSGLTGGAIPARRRTVILSMARLKAKPEVDVQARTIRCQAGVITIDAIKAAAEKDLLFTVDPASKNASSIGGNVSENSGGPFAFEYGTTIDNILSYRLVTPTGDILEVKRKDHPWRKIMPEDTAVFEVFTEGGRLLETVALSGETVRAPGLGKDVTDKFLGGLPGVQKEGVDGVVTEATFTCHPQPKHSRVLCLEFFGRSMHNAMLVIKDFVGLRDTIRREGDLVKMSALEEFGIKYVQAIEYSKKSEIYEGDPISVLIIQLDADDTAALDAAVARMVDIAGSYHNVDVFAARDDKEAELFWEDRHKLSAISKRTSGFKINEDIVIPLDTIPEFSDFLETLNLTFMARAYRGALQRVGKLDSVVEDRFINMEFTYTSKILKGEVTTADISDEELAVQVFYFFKDLKSRYPKEEARLEAIYEHMAATRIIIANHMHAGDGNNHVNIPVNSNDQAMLAMAEEAAEAVFTKVHELKGEVTGEHGIGITKIAFFGEEKMRALRDYKRKVDPRGVLNPGKLTERKLPVKPYTFSFNRLIRDLEKTGLPDKERLMALLKNIQVCNRCGKCKQVCPMYDPVRLLMYHPRNKNISLGALIEAVYYSQVTKGAPDKGLLDRLRSLMEHCTACGRCTSVCSVKIDSASVALNLRAFLEDKESSGHPIKRRILGYLAADPARRAPLAARAAGLGQRLSNKALSLAPQKWRERAQSPLFNFGPEPGMSTLAKGLSLDKGGILVPRQGASEAVLYFPGCGGGLFHRSIGMATVMLLLKSGAAVIIPQRHLCCGYPLLASGCEETFLSNAANNAKALAGLLERAQGMGLMASHLLTACGSCRDGLSRHSLDDALPGRPVRRDVTQYLLERLQPLGMRGVDLVYHAACHPEWTELKGEKATQAYKGALSTLTGATVQVSRGCCGESGLGALTSPDIYNRLREKKRETLAGDLEGRAAIEPVIVGCPSCKIGIARCLLGMGQAARPVLHTMEYLAGALYGPDWEDRFRKDCAKAAANAAGVRELGA